ncbi:RNA polymerase sigma factor [uncultured Fibrella sp.]|uniref:RNA polymerase sigma factor n=1 Tax=uncultured Fibrella sp. TaxID=1284596 RepID=UPI0035CAEFAD
MAEHYTEETLVLSVQRGEQDAFQYLVRYYRNSLLSVITAIIKDPDEAQDVLQDTYVKIWSRFHYYNSQHGALFTWLLHIARNTALDALRRRKILYVSLDSAIEMIPSAVDSRSVTDFIEVESIVSQYLQPHQWHLIRLAYWQGNTHKEIAEKLVMPLGTVKTRLLNSLIRLRPIFR